MDITFLRTISPSSSLVVDHLLPGDMGKFGGDGRWGGEKWRAGAQRRQYLRTRKGRGKVTMEGL